ncbi:MAG TPA: c-type cytochrome domain-containing protein, partial [Kofleriaceae bacterium]|nr:c-type cytochrome domain-containing protein [Kofleriaceae bacterium]
MRSLGLLALVLLGSPRAARAGGEADAAAAVLARHCVRCHGHDGPGEGGFTSAADLARLAAGDLIVRGDPAASLLYRRLRAGEMPPRKVAVRPTADEIEAVRAWIAAGAPPPGAAPAPARIGWAGIDRLIADDLARLPPEQRSQARYLSIAHWRDAGRPAEELARARRAAAKLVASLTWEAQVPALIAVDAEATVFRVDLHALGWPTWLWDEIAARDPFAVRRRGPDAVAAQQATGTQVPCVRIDWLVAAASRPPLYHQILGLPDRLDGLAARLGIDLDADLAAGRVVRAGFARSGVSRNNRLIERHALPGGGYLWRSYDFAGATGPRNLFDHPLGPGGDADDFAPDGGELIFSLPDGMQAYYLVDGAGRRLDRASTAIVLDRSRADAAVETGVSCMGCHAEGLIVKADELRAHVDGNRAAFASRRPGTVERVLALHPAADALAAGFAA